MKEKRGFCFWVPQASTIKKPHLRFQLTCLTNLQDYHKSIFVCLIITSLPLWAQKSQREWLRTAVSVFGSPTGTQSWWSGPKYCHQGLPFLKDGQGKQSQANSAMPVSQTYKVLEWNLMKERRDEVGFKMQKVMCNRKLLGDLCISSFQWTSCNG